MSTKLKWIDEELDHLKQAGLYNKIRTLGSPQGAWLIVDGKKVLNFCSNNYLGLANHPRLLQAAEEAMAKYGLGPGAVRTIAGTMDLHLKLENRIAKFKRVEDAITFQSGFTANLGLIPAIVGKEDAIFSDELNHASIIDGCRLSGAAIIRYDHADPASLERVIQENQGQYRRGLVVTDGVFSMDGDLAKLDEMADLCQKYDALLFVDESHASGFIGKTGRGTHEHCNVMGRIDIITTTFGKALGGASGGCVSGHREIIEMCRQKARPYLFSNTISPVVVAGVLEVFNILQGSTERRDKLEKNTAFWRKGLTEAGFIIKEGESPIVPVMLFNAKLAQDVSRDLFAEGIYAIGFFFPVVPNGQARIRTQISAGHEIHHLEKALEAFTKIGKKYGILGLTKQEIIAKYGM